MKFYRVGNINTKQGLWYDMEGNFTGMIHNELNFVKNRDLQMPFDPNVVGYLSAVSTLESLSAWFNLDDLKGLYPHGYRVLIYESEDYKTYNGHYLIDSKTSRIINILDYGKI